MEANDIVNYIYPHKSNTNLYPIRYIINTRIIHNNVSTYAQALMKFHKTNPVLDNTSHKRLKLQFNENLPPTFPILFTIRAKINQ